MKGVWSGYWATSYHPARVWWLRRGVSLLLALDALILMLEHGGRYGVGGFNVAHFAWLDGLVGVPSPSLYLSLLTGSALLALCGAMGALPRAGHAALLLTYSLAWALSQHDSYQHHYLLSWLLLWLLWLPMPRLAECQETEAATSAAGLPLFATTCATVYWFTAISKSSGLWQSGAVLRHLAATPGPFASLQGLAQLGLGDAAFRWAAHGVWLLQLLIAAAYALAPIRDAAEAGQLAWGGAASLTRRVCTLGWLGALGFHLLTEFDAGFAIGWFSYYMVWIACVLLAPRAWLAHLSRLTLRCLGLVLQRFTLGLPSCLLGLFVASAAAVALTIGADLPGVARGACCVGLAYMTGAFLYLRRGKLLEANALALSVAASLSLLVLALSATEIRFDYYRRAAGELRHMGELQQSLELYRKAQRHAPPGRSRQQVIRELERKLSEHGRE
jgi:hypothetical protein